MIFPGFPGVLSFFQVFQVEWEPCAYNEFGYSEHPDITSRFFLRKEDS